MIIEKLKQIEPKRNFIFTAIEQLKTAEEIKIFYRELIKFYGNLKEVEIDSTPEGLANNNIGYILGYYSSKEQKLWFGALSDISHPFFGRRLSSEISQTDKTSN